MRSITLHQAIHGYRGGHRLLGASRTFPQTAARTLLYMSDMSGSTMVPGFDEYITGYPVPELGLYAIAKTWYAPEMERPGCVWTHSLLVAIEDLHLVTSLDSLLGLFRRPGLQSAPVDAPLTLSLAASPPPPASYRAPLAENVLRALYSSPTRAVVIAARSSREHQDLVLDLWSQQWSSLRAAFSFCTGSLAPRELYGAAFDLQVAPRASLSKFRRRGQSVAVVESSSEDMAEPWVSTATLGLARGSHFRDFLHQYASEAGPDRELYRPLADVFYLMQLDPLPTEAAMRLVERVAEAFPERDMGTLLKHDALCRSTRGAHTEQSLFIALGTTPSWHAYDPVALGVSERAESLWRCASDLAADFVVQIQLRGPNPLGAAMLRGVARALAPEDAIALSHAHSGLLSELVAFNATLALSSHVWSRLRGDRSALFLRVARDLRSSGISNPVPQLVRACVLASADDVVEAARKCLPIQELVPAVLDAANEVREPISHRWRSLVGEDPTAALRWLAEVGVAATPTAREVVFAVLDPSLAGVARISGTQWVQILGPTPSGPVSAFLLALGFSRSDSDKEALIEAGFQPTFDAVRAGSLPDRHWSWLEPLAPPPRYWLHWDRCERLARALMRRWLASHRPAEFLLRSAKSESALRQVLGQAVRSKPGRRHVREFVVAVRSGRALASEAQLRALAGFG